MPKGSDANYRCQFVPSHCDRMLVGSFAGNLRPASVKWPKSGKNLLARFAVGKINIHLSNQARSKTSAMEENARLLLRSTAAFYHDRVMNVLNRSWKRHCKWSGSALTWWVAQGL